MFTDAEGLRLVEVESTAPPGCAVCGVLAGRVHSRRRQRLRDLPVAGLIEVVWIERRWFCDEPRCPRGTFSEVTDQVPAFARSTARLCQALVTAVVVSGPAASEVARAHRVSWWLVASMLSAAADVLIPDPDQTLVARLGVDEHRYRSVRFFRDEHGGWRRYEPWITTLVDTDTGRVLGVVDGRDSSGVGTWLAARSQTWRDAAQVVAIDPSSRCTTLAWKCSTMICTFCAMFVGCSFTQRIRPLTAARSSTSTASSWGSVPAGAAVSLPAEAFWAIWNAVL